MSKNCVLRVSNNLKQDLPLSNATSQGRKKAKKATNSTEDHHLLQIMKKDRAPSSKMLAAEWNLSNGKNLPSSTAHRRLGYKCYTAKRKPIRNPRQIKERLKFAKEHQQWLNQWKNVI